MKATIACAITGLVLGIALSVAGLVFGIFACIPAGPFETQNLEVCISFIVLSALGVACMVAAGIGACVGAAIDACMV